MSLITIKDLAQSDDLDRQAMRSIMGGGHIDARPLARSDQSEAGNGRIIDYPPGFGGRGLIRARSGRTGG
jgi:hypothetical protein